jgi:hypothetical protein
MRTARILPVLAVAASIAAAAPASSSARPIDERPDASSAGRCYQLNPPVAGRPRGSHRVLCGPTGLDSPVTVSELHSQSPAGAARREVVTLGVAVAGLALSAAALIAGRRRSHRPGAHV